MNVSPKKNLGQHFLTDEAVAADIVNLLTDNLSSTVLEIGPGTGILTKYLLKRHFNDFRAIEIDNESYYYLKNTFPDLKNMIRGDFLKMDLNAEFNTNIAIIGNFPYNISSQILFKVLEYKQKVVELCGMFQKEVAERICAGPGSRNYGILSVLLQAYYTAEYMFTVEECKFNPPPKVKSGVIRLLRNNILSLPCNETMFIKTVKAAFNQRRKILKNSISSAFNLQRHDYPLFHLRPEQLSIEQFIDLTNWIEVNHIE